MTLVFDYSRIVGGLNGRNKVYNWEEKVGKVKLTFNRWHIILISAADNTLLRSSKAFRAPDIRHRQIFINI